MNELNRNSVAKQSDRVIEEWLNSSCVTSCGGFVGMSSSQISHLLQKIHYEEKTAVEINYDSLASLLLHYIQAIPFCNLGFYVEKPINLHLPAIYSRLVDESL